MGEDVPKAASAADVRGAAIAAAALAGSGCGLLTLLAVQFLLPARGIVVAFPWYAMIGLATTFTTGLAASLIWQEPPHETP